MTNFAATQTDTQSAADVVLAHSGHRYTECAQIAIESAEENLTDAGRPNGYDDQINAAAEYLLTVDVEACPFCS